jgi:hypothetical protein
MLLLSIAKWRCLLISQSLVYDGDRQAPPDISNLLPEGTDLDPDTWLTRHMSILAFPCRKAGASSSRRSFESKRYIWRNSYVHTRSNGFGIHTYSLLTHVSYVDLGTIEKDPSFSSQNNMVKHTTSCRNIRDAHSFSRQLIFHFDSLTEVRSGLFGRYVLNLYVGIVHYILRETKTWCAKIYLPTQSTNLRILTSTKMIQF